MTVLDKIISYKKDEVALAKANTPLSALETLASDYKPKAFIRRLQQVSSNGMALIAEVKKASPSKGLIREDFSPAAHAQDYVDGGAACLSVLTDTPSFQGSADYLRACREAVSIPILRKDFMIDPYQITEARAWGADCILLIMACLSDLQARELYDSATAHGLDTLVEVHDEEEMRRAGALGAKLIGVNNRNLKTFQTSLDTTVRLAPLAPKGALLVSESGIFSHQDMETLSAAGARAFLVGESLMRQDGIASATRFLLTGQTVA